MEQLHWRGAKKEKKGERERQQTLRRESSGNWRKKQGAGEAECAYGIVVPIYIHIGV